MAGGLATPPAAPERAGRATGWPVHLAVVIGYVACAVIVTWPLVTRLTVEVAGNSSDIFIYPWSAWWVTISAARGENPFFTPFLYFPEGASLAFQNMVLPATGWAMLLRPANLVTFYNLLLLAGFVLSALAAYALALYVTRWPAAAALAGLVFGFAPYRVEQARSHLTTVTALFLPLMLLAFLWSCNAGSRRGRIIGLLGAAVAAVLALLVRADHAIAGVYILMLFAVYPPFPRARMSWRQRLLSVGAVGACALVLAAPYLALWVGHGSLPDPPGGPREKVQKAVSVERLFVPARTSLASRALRGTPSSFEAEPVAFVGFTVLLLTAAGGVWLGRDRQWRFWALVGLLFTLMALGPRLVLGGGPTGIPLPYEVLPGIGLVRNPRRFMSAAMLGFAVAGALSWRAAAIRLTESGRRRAALTGALALLLLVEYAAPPLPTTRPSPSAFYGMLAEDPETFGLVEIPSNTRQHDKLYMFYQTMHGKPIHAGHMGRIPAETFHFVRSIGLLNFVAHEGRVAHTPEVVDVSQDLDLLRANGFRYVIFHTRFREGGPYRGINQREANLLAAVDRAIGPPVHRDDLIIAYDLRRPPVGGVSLSSR